MFLGHYGVGFGAKGLAKEVSLGTLFLATQLPDFFWSALVLASVETVRIEPGITKFTPLEFVSYPISHSLLMAGAWILLVGGTYWLLTKKKKKNLRAVLVLGVCVASHWILDLVSHGPDLPLYPGSSLRWGLGLWNCPVGTVLLEGILFVSGVVVYRRVTRARNRSGQLGFWVLVALLALIYVGNIFGPPPPSPAAIGWVGQLQWIFVLWAYWVNKNRIVGPPEL